ncbi:MAG: acylphosphatase, partial [Paracoccaceae bacterium]
MTLNAHDADAGSALKARDIVVTGRVQGVGFRPFVYRLAHRFGLTGGVSNVAGQVVIHVEGADDDIARFETALTCDAPPLARPLLASSAWGVVCGSGAFVINASASPVGNPDVHLPPDLFCCADCVAEMQTPSERRYRYPFTNCTQCGPRYTIIRALPYDRSATSMAGFAMCAACRAEYDDPGDRRFHAQPLACPDCGPSLVFCAPDQDVAGNEPALQATVA